MWEVKRAKLECKRSTLSEKADSYRPDGRFIKVYRSMWFSGGATACNVFMTVRGKLAYLSSGISTWQSTSVQRTISGVFQVFVYILR